MKLALFIALALIPFYSQAAGFAGTYTIYEKIEDGSQSTQALGTMTLTENGSTLTVSGLSSWGVEWSGTGTVSGNTARFAWQDDGVTGNTDLTADSNGQLTGHSVSESDDWWYIAVKH